MTTTVETKMCRCGKAIVRNTKDNLKWARRKYCSRQCQAAGLKALEWSRRMR